jgi:hypothetical protein
MESKLHMFDVGKRDVHAKPPPWPGANVIDAEGTPCYVANAITTSFARTAGRLGDFSQLLLPFAPWPCC